MDSSSQSMSDIMQNLLCSHNDYSHANDDIIHKIELLVEDVIESLDPEKI